MYNSLKYNVIKVTPPGHTLTYVYDYYVWIHPSSFKDIFGLKRIQSGKRCYVKITNGNHHIYRAIETAGYQGVTKATIGLSYNSICDLKLKPNSPNNVSVKVKPSYALFYLLHHPDSVPKTTFIVSLVTCVIGILIGHFWR